MWPVVGIAVSVTAFVMTLVLSGGITGIMVRRAKQRQDLITLLEECPDDDTARRVSKLRAEQRDDLDAIMAERDRGARIRQGIYAGRRPLMRLPEVLDHLPVLRAALIVGYALVHTAGLTVSLVLVSTGLDFEESTRWYWRVGSLALGIPALLYFAYLSYQSSIAIFGLATSPFVRRYQPWTLREVEQAATDGKQRSEQLVIRSAGGGRSTATLVGTDLSVTYLLDSEDPHGDIRLLSARGQGDGLIGVLLTTVKALTDEYPSRKLLFSPHLSRMLHRAAEEQRRSSASSGQP